MIRVQNTDFESHSPVLVLMGGSGFVGSALGEKFAALGWKIRLLTRTLRPFHLSYPCEQFIWDGKSIPPEVIKGASCVINLAGQPIFDRAWTPAYRKLILDSRLLAGLALAEAIENQDTKPQVVIQISGTDFYGMEPRGEACDESASTGEDFMAEVGRAHEEAAERIATHTRVCTVRMGLVLGWEGGGLPQLWDVYASGCGGALGDGKQWMNWVHLDDVVAFCITAASSQDYADVYNLVAPGNSTNRQFHYALCEHTPSLKLLTAPKLYLKAMMGQRAHFLLQAPQVATPRARAQGFTYQYPDLESALNHLVGKREHPSAHCIKVRQWLPILPSEWETPAELVPLAQRGLCKLWYHRQSSHPLANGTLIEDSFEYTLPWFPFGQAALWFVRSRLRAECQSRRKAFAELARLALK